MPVTDTSTRQRLLELWEKCPECRPEELWIYKAKTSGRIYFADHPPSAGGGGFYTEETAFALANDAMVRWLAKNDGEITVTYCQPDRGKVEGWCTVHTNIHFTLTDALISAVEAVKERQMGEKKLTSYGRLALARALVCENIKEVKNDIGGVVGYTLSLDEDRTRELWNLLAWELRHARD